MQTATVITQGSSQTVQFPDGFHINSNEVYVKHLGKSVLLIPKDADPWDLLEASLDQFTDDFMRGANPAAAAGSRRGPFA